MPTPKNILVPTDFTKYSDKALNDAILLAQPTNAKIHLLHVIDHQLYNAIGEFGIGSKELNELEDTYLSETKELMEKQLKGSTNAGGVQVLPDIKTGMPAEVILDELPQKEIDLVIIGSHGKKGFLRGLIGDVTYKVVKNAACSVMVVRQ